MRYNYCLPRNSGIENTRLTLSSFLESSIQHPEVYRRMKEVYNLDQEKYFQGILVQKRKRFLNKPIYPTGDFRRTLSSQQSIIDGFEYFYYSSKAKRTALKLLKKNAPKEFDLLNIFHSKNLDFYRQSKVKASAIELFTLIKTSAKGSEKDKLNNLYWDHIAVF